MNDSQQQALVSSLRRIRTFLVDLRPGGENYGDIDDPRWEAAILGIDDILNTLKLVRRLEHPESVGMGAVDPDTRGKLKPRGLVTRLFNLDGKGG